jgi:hypothetical protein
MVSDEIQRLRQAGFSDEEILAEAGFSPEEISPDSVVDQALDFGSRLASRAGRGFTEAAGFMGDVVRAPFVGADRFGAELGALISGRSPEEFRALTPPSTLERAFIEPELGAFTEEAREIVPLTGRELPGEVGRTLERGASLLGAALLPAKGSLRSAASPAALGALGGAAARRLSGSPV